MISRLTNTMYRPALAALAIVAGTVAGISPAHAGKAMSTDIKGIGGLCVDLPYQDTSNGKDLWMWGCNSSSAQKFTFHTNGEIKVKNRCLDVEGPSTRNGTDAQIWQCMGGIQQKFDVTVAGEIKSRFSHKCLTVKNSSTSYRTAVEFEPCDGRSSQRFAFYGLPTKTQYCGGWWINEVKWDFTSRKGMVLRASPTKKGRAAGQGWDNVKNCIPSDYRNSLYKFDESTGGVKSMKQQFDCHGFYAKLNTNLTGGPTWDLESYSNLSKWKWELSRCNGDVLR